ncbi:MAG: Family 9 glycosyl transferase [Chlorobi bacterium]|nr:Family 9 glycosyl transferase [Chlorobiota bacterium]
MNILVIRFSSAGDIILTSLFLRALRGRFPEATIEFMTKREFAPLVEHSPHVDRVITIEPGWGIRDLAAMKSGLIREKGGDYDIVFDLHNSLRSRYVRGALGKETAVIAKPSLAKWLLVHRKINRLRPIVPIPERYLAVGEPFGLKNDGMGLELFTGGALSPILPVTDRPTIALAPGARHATKLWPAENFAALGTTLARERNARIILFGSAGERELCGSIARDIDGDVVNLAGHITLPEAAAAMDCCDVVVSNDSALAHVAAARKRPVVAIFGSTVQEFGFAPYGTRSLVVENEGLYCRPCTAIGRESCPERHFRCMKEITAADVMGAIAEIS